MNAPFSNLFCFDKKNSSGYSPGVLLLLKALRNTVGIYKVCLKSSVNGPIYLNGNVGQIRANAHGYPEIRREVPRSVEYT